MIRVSRINFKYLCQKIFKLVWWFCPVQLVVQKGYLSKKGRLREDESRQYDSLDSTCYRTQAWGSQVFVWDSCVFQNIFSCIFTNWKYSHFGSFGTCCPSPTFSQSVTEEIILTHLYFSHQVFCADSSLENNFSCTCFLYLFIFFHISLHISHK